MSNDNGKPYTAEQLAARPDRDIDYSDIPELDADFWQHAQIAPPATKTGIYIRLDTDILQWLKRQGQGYQTRINTILRSYYQANRE